MEVPDPRQVYNGTQRGAGAVASDIEVVPDTEDEATMEHGIVSTMADRHAMSDDMDIDFEDEVSRRSLKVAAVVHSPATVKWQK